MITSDSTCKYLRCVIVLTRSGMKGRSRALLLPVEHSNNKLALGAAEILDGLYGQHVKDGDLQIIAHEHD